MGVVGIDFTKLETRVLGLGTNLEDLGVVKGAISLKELHAIFREEVRPTPSKRWLEDYWRGKGKRRARLK